MGFRIWLVGAGTRLMRSAEVEGGRLKPRLGACGPRNPLGSFSAHCLFWEALLFGQS